MGCVIISRASDRISSCSRSDGYHRTVRLPVILVSNLLLCNAMRNSYLYNCYNTNTISFQSTSSTFESPTASSSLIPSSYHTKIRTSRSCRAFPSVTYCAIHRHEARRKRVPSVVLVRYPPSSSAPTLSRPTSEPSKLGAGRVRQHVALTLYAAFSTVISVFAIVILGVLGLLFNANHHGFVGGVEDPEDGPAVAGTIFAAVIVYAVRISNATPLAFWRVPIAASDRQG